MHDVPLNFSCFIYFPAALAAGLKQSFATLTPEKVLTATNGRPVYFPFAVYTTEVAGSSRPASGAFWVRQG
jgi:hypothetical protein